MKVISGPNSRVVVSRASCVLHSSGLERRTSVNPVLHVRAVDAVLVIVFGCQLHCIDTYIFAGDSESHLLDCFICEDLLGIWNIALCISMA